MRRHGDPGDEKRPSQPLCGELPGGGIPIPAEVLEAVRASREHDSTAEGLRYRVEPIEVDAGACARVPPGELGAVLMKMDVAVEPVP